MLTDALSDNIRVESHFIKECALQLKASSSAKGLQLVIDKNQEVTEEYSKNINVRKTKTAAEFAFFHESTKCRRLIRKKNNQNLSRGSDYTLWIYTWRKKLDREMPGRRTRVLVKRKKERIHLPQ